MQRILVVMELVMDLDLDDLRLRTLTVEDAALLVEATRAETGRALWGPSPAGPCGWRSGPAIAWKDASPTTAALGPATTPRSTPGTTA